MRRESSAPARIGSYWDIAARCGDLDSLDIARLTRKSAGCKCAKAGEIIEFTRDKRARPAWENDAEWERDAWRRARELANGKFATADELFSRMRGSWGWG